jgi:hypothetical protein
MKNRIVLALAALILCAGLTFTTGCTFIKSNVTPAVVQQGVATGVIYAVQKYPTAVPYLQAAAPIICMTANGTNFDPAQIVAAIEKSDAGPLKTPEAVLILNGALTLYIGIWDSYGADAVNRSPDLKLYLQATCNGMNAGLAGAPMLARPGVSATAPEWPLIKF